MQPKFYDSYLEGKYRTFIYKVDKHFQILGEHTQTKISNLNALNSYNYDPNFTVEINLQYFNDLIKQCNQSPDQAKAFLYNVLDRVYITKTLAQNVIVWKNQDLSYDELQHKLMDHIHLFKEEQQTNSFKNQNYYTNRSYAAMKANTDTSNRPGFRTTVLNSMNQHPQFHEQFPKTNLRGNLSANEQQCSHCGGMRHMI